MNQQQFEAVIRNKIETIGDGEKQRRYIYAALREKMLALAAKSPGETERWRNVQAAFDAAVDAVESTYATPAAPLSDAGTPPPVQTPLAPTAPVIMDIPSGGAPFRSPDEAPKSVAEYFWIKVAAGCAAFGGVLDFLKPIVDLQSPSVVVAALAAVALTVAARLNPGRAALFGHVRNVSLAVAAAVIGLFGLQSQFPGNAPNGAIAEVLPGLVQLQAAIDGLRAPIEKIGQDTGRIAEATDQMKKQLEEIAESSDSAAVAREALRRAGYQLDADNLYLAITSDDQAMHYFEEAGFSPSESEIDAMLSKAPTEGGAFDKVFGYFRDYGPAPQRRRLKGDLDTLFSLAKPTKSVDPIFVSVCGNAGKELAAWLSSDLSSACSDLVSFYQKTSSFLQRHQEFNATFADGMPYFMPPTAQHLRVEEINKEKEKKTSVVGYVDGLVSVDSYSMKLSESPYIQWADIGLGSSSKTALLEACQIAAEGGMCTARIFFMILPDGNSAFLGATNHAPGPFPGPGTYAATASGATEWGVATAMRNPGIRVFAGAYDRGSKLSALLYCEMMATDGASPGLSFRPNTEESAIDAHVREPYPPRVVGTGTYFVAFNGGRDGYTGEFDRRGGGIVDVYLTNKSMLEDMKNGRSIQLYVDDALIGQVSLAGFTAAYTKLRELTQCGW